jgi:predicted Zn-ribbon and HTH transcriptional regulator
MVFTKIGLYYGNVVDLAGLLAFAKTIAEKHVVKVLACLIDTYDEDILYDLLSALNECLSSNGSKLQVVTPPCCSPINGKQFVIGLEVATIHRTYTKCDGCDEFSCDTCIGNTINGYYDVSAMQESILRAVSVCDVCYYDRMPEGPDAECPRCPGRRNEGISKHISDGSAYYYILDDCLSCS